MSDLVRSSKPWLPRLLKFWAIFAVITFIVMLFHQSDNPVVFKRYSVLVFSQLTILFAVAIITGGFGVYLNSKPALLAKIDGRLEKWRKQRIFAPIVLMIAGCLLVAAWLFFLGDHIATYGFLRMFVGFSILVSTLALLHGGGHAKEIRWKLLPVAIMIVLGIVAIAMLPYFPVLAKADESFVFSMARNALETGNFRPTIYRQAFPPNYYGGIWIWSMATWLKFTNISFVSGRAYVLFLSAISICFLYFGTKRLYDRVTACYVVLIGIYSFASLNHIRFDIHTAFWLSVGLFFYSLTRSSGRWWTYFAGGFAIGMCIDSNPAGYCFGIGFALVFGWDYILYIRDQKRWFYRPFWLIALGGATALVIYLGIHAGGTFAGNKGTGDLLSTYLTFIVGSLTSGHALDQLGKYFSIFLTNQPILFGLMVLGLITAWRKKQPMDRLLLIMYAVWIAVIVFAYFYFPVFYMVLGLPLFVILAARGAATGLPELISNFTDSATDLARATFVLLSIWFLAGFINNLNQVPSQSLDDLVATGRQIGMIVPQDAIIVAAEPYYFGLLDHQQFVGGSIENLMVNNQNLKREEVWQQIKPDAVVFSQGWPSEPERTPVLMAYLESEQFGLRACYDTRSFGRVELWTRGTQSVPSSNVVCSPQS